MSEATQKAKQVYDDLCAAIEARNWHYQKEEEKLLVHFGVSGDDLPMHFAIAVDAASQYVRLLSPMPFDFPEDKRVEGAIASCAVNMLLAEGSFDIDLKTGHAWFRQSVSFCDSTIGDALFQRMISWSCTVIDLFNDLLGALATGKLSLPAFLQEINKK